MSRYNHSICDGCWAKHYGGRDPQREPELWRQAEKCCWCGVEHKSGIHLYQMNFKGLRCEGKHVEDAA